MHEHLLGEQQVLFGSIPGYRMLFIWEEYVGNSIRMVHELILHLLVFALFLIPISFNENVGH